ncbi:hypothetical protein [Lacticaseibacillus porcinae]|uniref:hypothetical protein n=1 Tax=Lacticaseibacillus porcinae TaxID=1123687 RepID=UPI000F799A5C|nr:hypothetical protein [Lacticaseibacillus porcinae]
MEDFVKIEKMGSWHGSREFDALWPDTSLDFWNICDDEEKVFLKWKGSRIEDYLDLADAYFESAVSVANEIMHAGHDNMKDDTWFLADLFLFRQAIELIIKATIYLTTPRLAQIQKIFENSKHNLISLFDHIKDSEKVELSVAKKRWLELYLEDVEYWDKQSSLFRFPFKLEFFDKRPPEFLNIYDTVMNLGIAFSLLHKPFDDKFTGVDKFQIDLPNQLPDEKLFLPANDGIGNCYLTGYGYSETYFAVIQGYLSVSEY